MKPKLVLSLAFVVALAPLAWAGPQAKRSNVNASVQSNARAHGRANLASRPSSTAVRSGTRISARLLTNLNAKKAKPGQRVEARVTHNVKQNGRVVIRKNARLLGHVVSARAAGKGKANSQLQVVFDHVVQGHTSTALNTVVTSIVSVPRAPMPEPMPAEPMAAPEGGGGGGGLLGGGGGAVGSTVGGAIGAAGNVGAMAGSTVGGAGRMGGQAAGSAANAITVTNGIGAIGAGTAANAAGAASAGASNGVANAALSGSAQASNQTAATSTFSRRHGNVELHSGTQLQFQVAGGANVRAPAPH